MVLPRRSIPSISGLIAFEATARELSFSKAAVELSLTQGAISKRIGRLEEVLGVELITRDAHQISLTSVGAVYLRQVQSQLNAMEQSISEVVNRAAGMAIVSVSAPTLFALNWLIPQLASFRALYPDIQISIHSTGGLQSSNAAHLDGIIKLTPQAITKPNAYALFSEDLLAVATPEFLRRQKINTVADLTPNVMLQLSSRQHLWAEWCREHCVSCDEYFAGPVYTNSTMLLRAAICGLGVALLPRFSVTEELANKTLVRVKDSKPLSECTYWFYSPTARHLSPPGKKFADWIARQCCSPPTGAGLNTILHCKKPKHREDFIAS